MGRFTSDSNPARQSNRNAPAPGVYVQYMSFINSDCFFGVRL